MRINSWFLIVLHVKSALSYLKYLERKTFLNPAGIRTTDRPARSVVVVPITLSWLDSYLSLHENQPVGSPVITGNTYMGFQLLDHRPYSPDLAPSDYHLFPGLEKNN